MITLPHREALHESTKLKLRATALLAEFGDDPERVFEASVLFHEAARAEQRALRALEAPTPATTLCSLMEVCTCLIDGRDPARLELEYAQYLRVHDTLAETESSPLRQKFLRRLEPFLREHEDAIRSAPPGLLQDPISFWSQAAIDKASRKRALKFISMLLDRFPGSSASWLVQALLMAVDGREGPAAWAALRKARQLEPFSSELAMFAHVLAHALPGEKAWLHLDGAYRQLLGRKPDIAESFGFVLGALMVAEVSSAPRRGELCSRAEKIAVEAIARVGELSDQGRVLVLLRLVGAKMRDGRPVTADDFRRAGEPRLWLPPQPGRLSLLELQKPHLIRPFAPRLSQAA